MIDVKSTQEFTRESKSGVVVVDFYAEWCGPCKQMTPVLQKISEEVTDVKFLKINVETCFEVSNSYNVSSIPTLIFLKDGVVVNQITGTRDSKKIKDMISCSK